MKVENLCIGVGSLINIFEPETISIGGSFAYFEKTLLNKLILRLKNDAGTIGSVLN